MALSTVTAFRRTLHALLARVLYAAITATAHNYLALQDKRPRPVAMGKAVCTRGWRAPSDSAAVLLVRLAP